MSEAFLEIDLAHELIDRVTNIVDARQFEKLPVFGGILKEWEVTEPTPSVAVISYGTELDTHNLYVPYTLGKTENTQGIYAAGLYSIGSSNSEYLELHPLNHSVTKVAELAEQLNVAELQKDGIDESDLVSPARWIVTLREATQQAQVEDMRYRVTHWEALSRAVAAENIDPDTIQQLRFVTRAKTGMNDILTRMEE